jgi:hypothetical protein
VEIVSDKCNNIILRDSFYSPKAYLNCLAYIEELLNTGKFVLIEKSCDIDKTKDENGYWIDDLIHHVIQCKKCGNYFNCVTDTYHGRGSFTKGK